MKRFFTTVTLILAMTLNFASAEPIKLLSYNIKGHGMTSSRLDDIAAVINVQNPDIVALQEVDNRNYIGIKHDYLSELAEATGMPRLFKRIGRGYRHALAVFCFGRNLLWDRYSVKNRAYIGANPVFRPVG